MNKKIGCVCMLCLMLTMNFFAQGQDRKNIVGIGAGACPEKMAWIGDPINGWADINASPVFQVFYTRQVLEAIRLSSYLEYENAKFKYSENKASRYNIGLNWLAQLPNKAFHAQFGGYIGYGFLQSDDWDQSLSGVDYGIMIGPAFEKDNVGVALHVQSGYAYYISSGNPDEVSYSKARLILKFYYKL
jgi:hypothetical protein